MDEFYIGVDAGGTKTAFVLVDSKAQIVSHYVGSAANYMVNGLDGVVNVLVKGINKLLHEGLVTSNQLSGAFISIAGFKDIQEDVLPITKLMKDKLPIKKFVLGNDVENAFAGSLGGKAGIQIIAGTGSIGYGRNTLKEEFRSGGWHHELYGDEGSGYWIGIKLLQAFSKQADGRMPKTLLYNHLKKVLNLNDDYELIKLVVEKWQSDRTKIASLSKECTTLALDNDVIALNIFKETVDELNLIIQAIKKKLMSNEHVQVSYVGGVFNAEKFVLNPLKELLKENDCSLVKPQYSALAGSVILALELNHKKISKEIKENLIKIT